MPIHDWKTDPRCTSMLEEDLTTNIKEMAEVAGFLHYHVIDRRDYAKRSSKGFPDWEFVHPENGAHFYVEAKRQDGKLSKDQERWIAALVKAGNIVLVWRPENWYNGDIEAIFTALSAGRFIDWGGPAKKDPGEGGTGVFVP